MYLIYIKKFKLKLQLYNYAIKLICFPVCIYILVGSNNTIKLSKKKKKKEKLNKIDNQCNIEIC